MEEIVRHQRAIRAVLVLGALSLGSARGDEPARAAETVRAEGYVWDIESAEHKLGALVEQAYQKGLAARVGCLNRELVGVHELAATARMLRDGLHIGADNASFVQRSQRLLSRLAARADAAVESGRACGQAAAAPVQTELQMAKSVVQLQAIDPVSIQGAPAMERVAEFGRPPLASPY
jgi:hypothetical protein